MYNLLSKEQFLNAIKFEKRRADRSKKPFSIVLFQLHNSESINAHEINKFLNIVVQNTRETDIKGWIDNNIVAMLLPETDQNGAKRCVDKISDRNGNIIYSVLTRTYPDDLFEKLLEEGEKLPDLYPFYYEQPSPSKNVQAILKRIIDIVGSLIGIIIFSPLMLITSILIKITSPGPVIFKQQRIGLKGRRFFFYKFRSMRVDGDDKIHREYVSKLIKGEIDKINQGDKDNPFYKIKDDPRVTKIGKIIRKTSIDELPQFFNVLKGEMSLVGPRPPIPYEVEKYEPWHLRRILEVKPGITGLWQVDGRSKTSFNDMVRLDLKYALNWSLWLDMKILLKTFIAVIRSTGAV